MSIIHQALLTSVILPLILFSSAGAYADVGHGHEENTGQEVMENMRQQHMGHEHGHDFQAMEEMTPAQANRMIDLMRDVGLALPPMDASRGRVIFAEKGCVICHSVNGVGVDVGPALDAAEMPSPMNAFEFAARMWRGAAAMTAMQEEELGGVIDLSGQDLADLIAFAHDAEEQKKLMISQVPKKFRDKIE